MEEGRFDELAKKLAGGASRRGVVRGLVGGIASAAALLPGRGSAQVEAEHCVPNGTICNKPRPLGTRHRHTCKDCCSGYTQAGAGGTRRCSCRPEGVKCGSPNGAKCCSGVCGANGRCEDPLS